MSGVAVKREMLDWAMERSEQSVISLRDRFPIEKWLSGDRQPTLKQLEKFASATTTPFGFFFLEEPPEERLPIPHFRTASDEAPSRPSPNLLETFQTMQRRQLWMRDFLIEQGDEPKSFVDSAHATDRVESVADAIKQTLGLDAGWAAKQRSWEAALRFLRETMEDAGILVVGNSVVGNNTHRKLDPNEFRGFVLVDEYAPLVFINRADAKAAQMFTLAHELAHVFFGSSAAFDLRKMQPADDPTELACNRVAAEFLVPATAIRQAWQKVQRSDNPFEAIARRFKVSQVVAARRALDLSLIGRERFFSFYEAHKEETRKRKQSRESSGGNFYASQNLRVGKRFARAVARATRQGNLLYSEAYRLTGLHGPTFDHYMDSIRSGGPG